MRVVFMGTPEFAVRQLEALYQSGVDLVGVFTKVDSPIGRKQILTPPAAKIWALEHNIPVYQPAKIKNQETLDLVRSLRPDLIVVAAYGKILPQELLDIPPMGSLNVHGSLLPELRGASPVQRSIELGLDKTGVTIMYMDAGMDTGDIIFSAPVAIDSMDTEDTLMMKVAEAGAELLSDTIKLLQNGDSLPRQKQDDAKATYAAMLKREDGLIDWNKSAWQIDCQLRAFHTWPGAYTFYQGNKLDLVSAVAMPEMWTDLAPGTALPEYLTGKHPSLYIACGSDASTGGASTKGTVLRVDELKLAGSAKTTAEAFLRGHSMDGIILGQNA